MLKSKFDEEMVKNLTNDFRGYSMVKRKGLEKQHKHKLFLIENGDNGYFYIEHCAFASSKIGQIRLKYMGDYYLIIDNAPYLPTDFANALLCGQLDRLLTIAIGLTNNERNDDCVCCIFDYDELMNYSNYSISIDKAHYSKYRTLDISDYGEIHYWETCPSILFGESVIIHSLSYDGNERTFTESQVKTIVKNIERTIRQLTDKKMVVDFNINGRLRNMDLFY